jgi:hypothetical protein
MLKEIYAQIEQVIEQRRKPRFKGSFPAIIHGASLTGQIFEAEAVVENISACGLYLRTIHFLLPGDRVSVVIQLSPALPNVDAPKTCLEIDGTIVRVDSSSDNRYGVGVEIERYCFL